MKYTTFSQRQAIQRGEYPPAAVAKTFPDQLRRNIATIFTEVLGMYYDGELGIGHEPVRTTDLWLEFERVMRRECEEYAVFADRNRNSKANRRIQGFIASASDPSVLDLLDVGVAVIVQLARPMQQEYSFDAVAWHVRLSTEGALAELDWRLRGAGTAYRIADDSVIISADDVTHDIAVVPALQCLRESGFIGAAIEFHEALNAYRNGQVDLVLTKANHAFESTMKIIAKKMGWACDDTATAKKLLDVMFANGLLPPMRESAMKALATMLESDVPTMRNKMPSAGHGRGDRLDDIPELFATYVLTAGAANIRLLVESYQLKRLKR
jgi:uncharacterized protein DUF7014